MNMEIETTAAQECAQNRELARALAARDGLEERLREMAQDLDRIKRDRETYITAMREVYDEALEAHKREMAAAWDFYERQRAVQTYFYERYMETREELRQLTRQMEARIAHWSKGGEDDGEEG